MMSMLRILSLGLLVILRPGAPAAAAEREPAGLAVESVKPRSVSARAGLEPGDVLLSWSCAASPPIAPELASGSLRTPFDLLPLEIEEAPRRAVTLRGRRGNEERAWTLGAGEWGLAARPDLPRDLAALDLEARARAEAGDLAASWRSWRSAAESARSAGDGRLAGWFLSRLAAALAQAEKWPEADAAYEEALAVLERESAHAAAAHLLRGWGETFERRGDWDAAIERYEKALALDRAAAAKSLSAARTLDALAIRIAKQSRYDTAVELLGLALEIREELAPGTTEVAGSLNKLGQLARLRGDFAAAEEYLTRGEELQRRLSPDDVQHAMLQMNLGNLAEDRGDLERAESLHRRAVAILEQVAPEHRLVEAGLHNLAEVAIQRGDLAAADDLLRLVLTRQERGARDDFKLVRTRISLGDLAFLRGDLEAAGVHYRLGLASAKRLSPEAREVALCLRSLGQVAIRQGDFAAARSLLWRAQEIDEKLAPETLRVAAGLADLARLETEGSGDLARAEELLRRALAIFKKTAPESLEASDVLRELGEVAGRRGRHEEALKLHRRALELQRRLAPGSMGEATALHSLGQAERRAGRHQEGIRDLCRAVDVLDRQRVRLGGTPEARTSFEASLGGFYHACMEGLLSLGRSAEAFHVLEMGRARSFLALLAERDLRLADLPPELAAERGRVNGEYDRVQSRLVPLSAGRDDAEIERLTGELRDLRFRQEEILATVRREAPRSAALEAPEPLDLAGARAALDPGTVLLAYSVGPERTWLFVVQPVGASGPGLSVLPVAIDAASLRSQVESFGRLLKHPSRNPALPRAQARRLYDLLVRPAEAQIAGAQRILLSLDGPLRTLSFAALLRGDRRYLVEWKPIHSALSATVYAGLATSRPPRLDRGEGRLTAFGDPDYRPRTPAVPADPEVREALRHGLSLDPLPLSGREVKSIAALFPRAEVYLGGEATEERAKSVGPESRLVHFACHGLLDERFPLNSALALSLPGQKAEGRDNGLLQAWEIFESVRLDADLVTLSACDTALGREMGGEGLVGLTRAFQYAGARSVLATLWGVSDRSTATFMERFYGHFRRGKPKDEALRAAQIDQIREGTRASHPFYWGAFQLTGDWQ